MERRPCLSAPCLKNVPRDPVSDRHIARLQRGAHGDVDHHQKHEQFNREPGWPATIASHRNFHGGGAQKGSGVRDVYLDCNGFSEGRAWRDLLFLLHPVSRSVQGLVSFKA